MSSGPVCGDGLIVTLLRNNFEGVISVDFWLDCTAQIFKNGLLICLILLSLLLIFILPILLSWSFCRVKKNRPWMICSAKKRKIFKTRDHVKRNRKMIYLLSGTILVFIILLAIYGLSLYSSIQLNRVLATTNESSDSNSTISSAFPFVEVAIRVTIDKTRLKLTDLVQRGYPRFLTIGGQVVSSFIDQLLEELNITALFKAADQLFDKFNLIKNSTETIIEQKAFLATTLDKYDSNLDEFKKYFKRLPAICSKLSSDLQRECANFQIIDEREFDLIFSSQRINIDPSQALLTFLDRFNINLTQIQDQLNSIVAGIDKQKSSITDELFTQLLNKDNILSSIDNLFSSTFEPIFGYIASINEQSDQYGGYAGLAIVIIASVHGVMFLPNLIIGAFCVYKSHRLFKDFTADSQSNASDNEVLTNQSLSSCNSSTSKGRYGDCSRCGIYSCVMISCVGFAILFLIILIFSILSFIMQHEVCYYLNDQEGIGLLDDGIDRYISNQWDDWMRQLQTLTTIENNLIISDYLQIKQPTRVYSTLLNQCQAENVGILTALGVRQIFDLKGLIDSPYVNNFLQLQESLVIEQVAAQNLSKMLGSSDSIVSTMNQAKELTRSLIDEVDHSQNIREIEEPIMRMSNPILFFQQFFNFMRPIAGTLSQEDYLLYYQSDRMKNSNISYKQALNSKDILIRSSLFNLQRERNMTALIDSLIIDFDSLAVTLNDNKKLLGVVPKIYNSLLDPLKINIYNLVSKYIEEIEREALDCHSIFRILERSEMLMCQIVSHNLRLFSAAFISLHILVMLYMWLLHFFFKQVEEENEQHKKYESEC